MIENFSSPCVILLRMKILGIDPGTATIGIGVVECDGENLSAVYFGWIETSKDDGAGKRLVQIHKEIKELIQKHQPDIIAIEKLFFFINAKTAMAVAESIGVIKLAAESEGTKVESYAPLQVKLAITGNGRADKKMVKSAVRSILKIRSPKKKKTHFDDLCDALAVAICYAKKNLMVSPCTDEVKLKKSRKNRPAFAKATAGEGRR